MTSCASRNRRMVLAVLTVLSTALVALAVTPVLARTASSDPIPPATITDAASSSTECSDGRDNDGDGRIDYGVDGDRGCGSRLDNSEAPDSEDYIGSYWLRSHCEEAGQRLVRGGHYSLYECINGSWFPTDWYELYAW
jgi:hypothetical protein